MTTYKARRLPRQPGPAGWNELLPPPQPPTPLEGDATADLAIIGAGFAGLSAARRLVQIAPQTRIAVLEAGRVAEGPAGRNSGFMVDLPHDLSSANYAGSATDRDQRQIHLNRVAIRFAAAAASEYGLDARTFDPSGKINGAASEAGDRHNRDYAAHLAQMNEAHETLDAGQMADITGTSFYRSGLYTPGTAILQPASYVRGLAQGLRPDIQLCENSPVTEIRRDGAGWALATPRGRLRADRVILATNGHAESFGFFARRLVHVFTYASMTMAFPADALGGEPIWGATPADPMGTTVRRIDDLGRSRIIIRTRFTYNPGMEVSEAALTRAGRVHDTKFAERFPKLAGIGMEYRWAGHLCLSRNGVPAHGEIDEGLFAAVCQNGLGTAKGTLAGMAAAELALDHDTDLTRAFAEEDSPDRLPPAPLDRLGATATIRWKEWRAGVE